MTNRVATLGLAALMLSTFSAAAADLATPPPPAVPAPCKATITFPAFGGLIKQNPNPGSGAGFGRTGTKDSQDRYLVEGGITF